MLARHGRNMIQLFLNQFIPEACLANNVIETFSRLYHRKGRSADARILVAEVGAWRIQSSVNCLAARAAISPGLDYKVFHSELIAPRHLCTTTPNSIAVIFLHSAFLVPESLTPPSIPDYEILLLTGVKQKSCQHFENSFSLDCIRASPWLISTSPL